MAQINYGVTLFLSLLLPAIPWLIFGIVVSSFLLVFVDEHQLVAKFPRNRILGAIVGSALGLLLPVCQYGNVPVTRRLLMQGVSIPVAISFLLAAPTINPIVIWLTWRAFPDQPAIVVFRLFFAWLIAIAVACIFSSYSEKHLFSPHNTETTPIKTRSSLLISGTFLLPQTDSQPLHRVGKLIYNYPTVAMTKQPFAFALSLFLENLLRELLELGSALVVGCAIAAAIQLILPQAVILNWGQTVSTQILVMLFLGVVLSLGSTASVFFLSNFTATFLNGSLLAFLLLGSIVDLKGIVLMLSTFRPKAIIYLVILISQLTFLLTLLLNFYVS